MRAVIQRVSQASVSVNQSTTGKIGKGLLVLLGIEITDSVDDIHWLSGKIANLRVFGDEEDKMNLSLREINGEILLISQFTLFASTKKGNRPSFLEAAKPSLAIPLYEQMKIELEKITGQKVQTGVFGEMMEVSLINEGPVTIIIDSKMRL
ncbi:MAG: D-tyrosyl-tRNA(Tyr) deacylase [Bacteroidetes bacterium RIFCSPLOWO2_02_FULL_36_8]|nr:MAG: D-tyrosyl-tRNA(Tyr) deacylase [Bacteroidetes bacterium RIFCSPLOWO2_02_FULL_36_8]OFY69368.1 MAG: D-tyrosyl-tRNA(Tyr) deacylase [Bacteroidetes bacterium RIFCSPLOWO2_12_FULL_37_12]